MKHTLITYTASMAGIWAVLAGIGLAIGTDEEIERETRARYCEDVAIHRYHVAKGGDPYQSPGHPDYRGIAADYCPGLYAAR